MPGGRLGGGGDSLVVVEQLLLVHVALLGLSHPGKWQPRKKRVSIRVRCRLAEIEKMRGRAAKKEAAGRRDPPRSRLA